MKVTNKSELFKAAWKMFRANKITFGEALKAAWSMYRFYLAKASQKPLEGLDKDLYKAMMWALKNVARHAYSVEFYDFKKFYNEHKSEGTIWQIAAKFIRIENQVFESFM